MRIGRALVGAALTLAGGCRQRAPSVPECTRGELVLELRDADGVLAWSLRDLGAGRAPSSTTPDASDGAPARELLLCNRQQRPEGALWWRPTVHRLGWIDERGRWRLELRGARPDLAGSELGQPLIRLHDDGALVHVLDGQGVPWGSFAPHAATATDEPPGVTLFDRASVPTTRVAPHDRTGVAFTRIADGAVTGYAVGKIASDAAPLLALPLPAQEQIALYWAWK